MTAQAPDSIFYKGEFYPLASEPLADCWAHRQRPRPHFAPINTACWRGYIAGWEIRDGRLYLIDIRGTLAAPATDDEGFPPSADAAEVPATLDRLFPGEPPPILADWFTGTLNVRQGEMLHYVHMGYGSVFEKTLHIDVVEGRVVAERVVDNRPPRVVRLWRRLAAAVLRRR